MSLEKDQSIAIELEYKENVIRLHSITSVKVYIRKYPA
jgi:hypothetical protein